MPPPYSPRFTRGFQQCVQAYDEKRRKRIRALVRRVVANPYAASHWLTKKKTDLRGKRARHDAGGRYVLIYMICRECLDSGFREQGYNACNPCDENRANVIFLAYGLHDETYATQWAEVVAAQGDGP